MFQVGGTDVLVHKYLGPATTPAWSATTAYKVDDQVSINNRVYKAIRANTDQQPPNSTNWEFVREGTPSQPVYDNNDIFNIQDLLFLENRDRKYDDDVYVMRCVYNIQDIDFNLSQFGLFLQNDTIFVTFHINDTVENLGRKILAGDVIELPHLKDDHALNDLKFALKRFYVIEEVTRAAEGFSVTWYPHLYRAKCKPLVDSQEFKQILDQIADRENFVGVWEEAVTYQPGDVVEYEGVKYTVIKEVTGIVPPDSEYYKLADTLRDIMSTYEREMQITQAVLDQAEADAPRSGYDTSTYYTVQVDANGKPELVTVDATSTDASQQTQATDAEGNLLFDEDDNPIYIDPNSTTQFQTAENSGYPGYLVGDGLPPNGAPFTAGIAFPLSPIVGQFCLRNDYMPKRLFRFDGNRWVKVEDDVRMTMSNNDQRNTYKTGFINNREKANFGMVVNDVFFVKNTPLEIVGTDYQLPVVSVTIKNNREIFVVTNELYNADYGVEVFVNEVPVKSVLADQDGSTAFTVKTKIKTNDRVEWKLYRESFDQKQSLHRALRPKADE
jgi:hypothetical protein